MPSEFASGDQSVEKLRRELAEAREQQAATSELLKVIGRTTFDLQPVFQTLAENAVRLCEAERSFIFRFDGQYLRVVATHNASAEVRAFVERNPIAPGRASATARAALHRRTIHVLDAQSDPEYTYGSRQVDPFRTILTVPILKADELLGVILIYRHEVRAFTDSQIALLETFAAHAVIAMENARLITETREALEQQTATAEVLQVINSSPGNLDPVFDATLESATRLCDAAFAILWLCDGERFHAAALHGVPARYAEVARVPCLPSPSNPLGRMLRGERLITSLDAAADDLYRTGDPVRRALVDLGRARSFIQVALVKDDVLLGSLTVYRQEVRAFSEKQIALLQNFAAQAVIAIENARLINETREALEQQTATAEILRVISQSPTDVQPVFEAVAKAAVRFCGANDAQIALRDGDTWFVAAHQGPIGSVIDTRRSLTRETGPGRAMVDAITVHLPDFEALDPVEFAEARRLGATLGFKAALSTPMLRDGVAIGAVSLRRSEVGAFTDRQIALVEAFASQAVIAIENTRLFAELNHRTADLQESLEYQTAISDVIQVISRSTFDLAPVLQALTESAIRLCEADMGFVCRREGDVHRVVAAAGSTPESARNALTYQQYQHDHLLVADRGSLTGRVVLEKGPVQIADVTTDSEYLLTQASALGGIRSQVGVPLMREESLIGVIILSRQRVQPFTSRQIELLQVFADQAVIAIENTRLLTEQREALEQQTATAEVLQVINASPGDLAPVFDAMLEKAMTLCGAALGFLTSYDGRRFTPVAMRGVPPSLAKYFTQGMDQPSPGEAHFRILQGEDVIHNLDQKDEEAYRSGLPLRRAVVDLGGARTALVVALRKDGAVLGALTIYRKEVRPFSDKQIALMRNFAAQAVIAMENARLLGETQEALERQTATTEVLETINSSPGDLQPVFEAILEKAMMLCDAAFGTFATFDGDRLDTVATRGVPEAFARYRLSNPPAYGPGTGPARLIAGEDYVHDIDAADSEAYRQGDPSRRAIVELGGARTILNVALRKDDALVGTISIYRREVKPFSDNQIALLQGFAAQAVIAMENARLLDQLRQRTGDLARTVDELTATGDVLKTISRSSTDLKAVLDTLLETVARLCRADQAYMFRRHEDMHHLVSAYGVPPEGEAYIRTHPFRPERGTTSGRVALERRTIHIEDVLSDPEYTYNEGQSAAGFRSMLGLPLLREDALIGVFVLGRTSVEPFTSKEIELANSFADQAVIAIENARLFEELHDRQAELRVTFDSMGDGVAMFDGDHRLGAWNRNFEQIMALSEEWLVRRPGYAEYLKLLAERGEFGTENVEAELASRLEDTERELRLERTRADGTVIEVRRNAVPGGGFVLIYSDVTEQRRAEAAIRAARDAAEEALEQQTATAEILRAISQSPTDVQPVLDAVVKAAVRFCGATDAVIILREGDAAVFAAHEGPLTTPLGSSLPLNRETAPGRAILDGRTCHLPDISSLDPVEFAAAHRFANAHGFRAAVSAPMIHKSTAIGVVALRKPESGPFTPRQIELLETFAAQAVIAIENVRLFTELRDSLERLRAAQANLIQAEKMASLGQLTAGIAHEIKNPLNFVNNFAGLSGELLDELKEAAAPVLAGMNEVARAEFAETVELLTGNLRKIAEHGRRADGIVKSMLSHSRGGTGDWQESNINALVEEALNLAYHGARAQDQDFNVTLERDFVPEAKLIEVVPQDITRVFLNLFGNGFYATRKRHLGGTDAGYRPTLTVSTLDLGEAVEVKVRDNGTGIQPEVRAKLFQPFFTTKPTGEGTGLGLSISYDIVTQQHGGTIEVESEPGSFTEFTVRLPRSRRVAQSRGA